MKKSRCGFSCSFREFPHNSERSFIYLVQTQNARKRGYASCLSVKRTPWYAIRNCSSVYTACPMMMYRQRAELHNGTKLSTKESAFDGQVGAIHHPTTIRQQEQNRVHHILHLCLGGLFDRVEWSTTPVCARDKVHNYYAYTLIEMALFAIYVRQPYE